MKPADKVLVLFLLGLGIGGVASIARRMKDVADRLAALECIQSGGVMQYDNDRYTNTCAHYDGTEHGDTCDP